MEYTRVEKLSPDRSGIVSQVINSLLFAVCVLVLFSFFWILFDKGAVMVAQGIVSV